ncbi:MAG: DUF86 domain-containing protein [Gemmatimonadota bacterium]
MSRRDLGFLHDMLDAGRLIDEFLDGVARDRFDTDLLLQAAVIRYIEVMGEAAKHVSEATRQRAPTIPWRAIAGMRDVLIHAYRSVDPDEVWRAATHDLPRVVQRLEPLIDAMQSEES